MLPPSEFQREPENYRPVSFVTGPGGYDLYLLYCSGIRAHYTGRHARPYKVYVLLRALLPCDRVDLPVSVLTAE
jgi:hypothetical protein